jgi:hypothetical protein
MHPHYKLKKAVNVQITKSLKWVGQAQFLLQKKTLKPKLVNNFSSANKPEPRVFSLGLTLAREN